MKTYLTLLLVVCQSAAVLAQTDKTPYLTKSLANNAINNVVVSTSAGGIMVSGESGQSPRIEVYIKSNNNQELSKQEIAKRLEEDYLVNIDVNGHELSATVKNKHNFVNWRRQLSISFKIYVPQAVSTHLRTSGGGISLDNLKGNEEFSTSGGGLDVEKVTGVIRGRTSGGGINVRDCGDDIDLHTSGGGIDARNCTGKISLVTSGGGLELNDLKGTINAHTSGGGINGGNIEGELITYTSGGGIDLRNMNCSLDAGTSGGDLRAEMKGTGKYVKLRASSGSIDLVLPTKGFNLDIAAQQVSQLKLTNFSGEWNRNHIRGALNGGGIPVEAHASSGNVNIRFN
ncbi:DUF4097 family beta strand repeat-containing protein [Mucilaginibacter sp. L3T2-6]|uniref:DUF4097 family beta strand repeat-containing protein n=1 Tax=Mucilaginibacter sp. L3T2-6 TaxID=3062491 RepID=UPI0026767F91|nr:DUF4097 family beta strand repeat-containing protein [Mucilaginibacter sp. L3T2-6]MDO3643788.1 DUF4097 family beta strand repeat-containing protein [Mucilaginibacter sp. L3T2-6]MDV6216239.1 DUF4097 family beta strand repeat-containing protein [Mucilaginibacter sp. L3T2-6]